MTEDIDAVYREISSLRDDIEGGREGVRGALTEMLDLHFQCQQLEQQNKILATRLVRVTVSISRGSSLFQVALRKVGCRLRSGGLSRIVSVTVSKCFPFACVNICTGTSRGGRVG